MPRPASMPAQPFLSGPLRAVAEMVDTVTESVEFDRVYNELRALSDKELAARGLERRMLARHVFGMLSKS